MFFHSVSFCLCAAVGWCTCTFCRIPKRSELLHPTWTWSDWKFWVISSACWKLCWGSVEEQWIYVVVACVTLALVELSLQWRGRDHITWCPPSIFFQFLSAAHIQPLVCSQWTKQCATVQGRPLDGHTLTGCCSVDDNDLLALYIRIIFPQCLEQWGNILGGMDLLEELYLKGQAQRFQRPISFLVSSLSSSGLCLKIQACWQCSTAMPTWLLPCSQPPGSWTHSLNLWIPNKLFSLSYLCHGVLLQQLKSETQDYPYWDSTSVFWGTIGLLSIDRHKC